MRIICYTVVFLLSTIVRSSALANLAPGATLGSCHVVLSNPRGRICGRIHCDLHDHTPYRRHEWIHPFGELCHHPLEPVVPGTRSK